MRRILFLMVGLMVLIQGCRAANDYVIVAYVTSWTNEIPDPTVMTHINYAFGHVKNSFDGVRIDNPERLKTIVALKNQNPKLKVMLSVGGWGSGNFSEMAATSKNRKAFAKDCRRVVEEFGLDGIDIDWEYPTQSTAKISSSPDDTKNFTLMMKALRKALGKKYLITMANPNTTKYVDFKNCIKYMDFVNLMAYDMGNPPYHHSALYPSKISNGNTTDKAVKDHLAAGISKEKLVVGVPFYGRGKRDGILRDYVKTRFLGDKYQEIWDDDAQVPYVADSTGKLVLGFESPRSLAIKCQYIIDNQLRGAMYWDYASDNSQGDERQTLAQSLLKNKKATLPSRRILVLAERGGQHEGFTSKALEWLKKEASDLNAELTVLESARNIKKGEIETYHLVLQLNYPPYAWSEAAKEDFERFIDRGLGSYIGFHHASLLGEFDGFKMWDWFSEFMGGIRYKNYIAEKTDGKVRVEQSDHPIMKGVNPSFTLKDDEWYIYDQSPRKNVIVLANVDESSYSLQTNIKMGDHPVVWLNPQKKARNIYFQFGHSEKLFESEDFVKMFRNALKWGLHDL